jgi:sterol desaturase/sphingolipid hydroxylase (fatty acid hydroxylase superfamily)
MTRSLIRFGYVPLMLFGLNGVAISLATADKSEAYLIAVIAAGVAISFGAERLLPYEEEWNTPVEDSGRDTIHAFVNETMILLSVAIIPVLALVTPFPAGWPSGLPFVVQVLLSVLVADFGITVIHLASHKIGWMWRLHAVHHSVKRSYGLNGLMKHPLHQTLEMAGGVLPLILLGIPTTVASALAVAVAIQLLLQHSNVDYRVGPARRILALNEGHRFHHLKWAGIGDVNFGLFTLTWDHLFGTFSFDAERRFTSDDLGMAAKPNYPTSYVRQLIEPFRASGACDVGDKDPADRDTPQSAHVGAP